MSTHTDSLGARTEQLVVTGRQLLSAGLRLVPSQPKSKAPLRARQPDPVTGWDVVFFDDAERWRVFAGLRSDLNLAVLWPGAQVDIDGPDAVAWLANRDFDLSRLPCWAVRTGRGVRYLFAHPGGQLRSITDKTHSRPDFLVNRLAVMPPSIHPNGHAYSWVPGHAPPDIPIAQIAVLPDSIAHEWRALQAPSRRSTSSGDVPAWLLLIYEALCDHLAAHGHRLHQQANGGVSTTCPLHDDRHPSLSLHPERGWKCHAGCGQGRLTALAARLGVRLQQERP